MKKKDILIILTFCLLILVCSFSGCISQHTSEINQATSYVQSANSRLAFLSSVDYKTVWVGNIKANASAAKSDLTEALKILNNIPLSDLKSQDQANLQGLKVMVNVDIELCDLWQGSLSDFIENSQTYAQTKDPGIATNSMNIIKVSLSNMKSSVGHMVDEMNSVNENDLSPELRPEFISLKSMTQSLQETISKSSNILENTCTVKCYSGSVLGTDCQCHPACGANYCSGNAHCCGGQCYTQCPAGSVMGNDCLCHR
jgi:outer membrane murein-binding lipoprotein Lpp